MTDTTIIDGQVDAVTREVGTSTRDGAPTRVATISQRYDTTVDDLWEACTSSERWYSSSSERFHSGQNG